MLALIGWGALVAFLVITSFVFVFSVKRVLESGAWCPWYIKAIAKVWLVIGVVSDVAFNWLWGTVIFRELPRELVFTARVKRHCRESAGRSEWRYKKACDWREFLNAVDPEHIKP